MYRLSIKPIINNIVTHQISTEDLWSAVNYNDERKSIYLLKKLYTLSALNESCLVLQSNCWWLGILYNTLYAVHITLIIAVLLGTFNIVHIAEHEEQKASYIATKHLYLFKNNSICILLKQWCKYVFVQSAFVQYCYKVYVPVRD